MLTELMWTTKVVKCYSFTAAKFAVSICCSVGAQEMEDATGTAAETQEINRVCLFHHWNTLPVIVTYYCLSVHCLDTWWGITTGMWLVKYFIQATAVLQNNLTFNLWINGRWSCNSLILYRRRRFINYLLTYLLTAKIGNLYIFGMLLCLYAALP